MCDQCKEIEVPTAHCRRFIACGLDSLARERFERLLFELEAAQRKQAAICLS